MSITMRMACLAAGLSLAAATPAAAADMYRQPYTVAAPLNVYSWAGPYVGANLGYQWGEVSNSGAEPAGVAGGAQIGFNWQTGQFVFGVETDLQISGAEDRFAAWQFSNPWFGTLRGRIGYAFNNILVYGTGGLAYGSLHADVLGATESHAAFGWTAGLGLELGLTQNWSVRAEYLYVGLGGHNFGITGGSHDIDSSVFRMGVNYRF
jgi:outer membrane immunogenic protein